MDLAPPCCQSPKPRCTPGAFEYGDFLLFQNLSISTTKGPCKPSTRPVRHRSSLAATRRGTWPVPLPTNKSPLEQRSPIAGVWSLGTWAFLEAGTPLICFSFSHQSRSNWAFVMSTWASRSSCTVRSERCLPLRMFYISRVEVFPSHRGI
jgi:hypothetical protein